MNCTNKKYDKKELEEIRRRYQKVLDGLKTATYISEEQAKNELKKRKKNG
ncbi:hypothetical protein H6A19_02460 [Clostridium saudiense]|uniref:Uncharacterized protein n=1 Tax=Clostridium saudiense TaxID=1414720 RepID=A0ABS2FD22_9CLOT|nr:hypothetical protein [Clostridium saudiense]MBM6818211.1 hypothetical protein [Clostridium saudiense]